MTIFPSRFKSQEIMLRISNQIRRQDKLREKYQSSEREENKPEEKHPLILQIEELTLQDLSEQMSVEALAGACALSRSQLHRKVKFLTGLSTNALLTKIRLDLARKEILETTLSISEIAYKYGYNDPAHFSRLFKKQFDTTPSETRNGGA